MSRIAGEGDELSEAKLHSKIRSIAGEWSEYIDIRVKRKED